MSEHEHNEDQEHNHEDAAKDALNQRLNEEEGVETTSPLGRVETPEIKQAKLEDHYREEAKEIGYKSMPLEALPSKGLFYPRTMVVQFRSAMVEEIKHYSGMDEADLMDVDAKIHSILKNCVRVQGVKGNGGHYKDLSEADKIFMLFAIRDLTMLKHGREHKLVQDIECESCGHKNKIELENSTFGYYDLREGIRKHYDESQRCLVVNHPRFQKPFKIYVPSMGVMNFIANYIKEKEEEKRMGNTVFYDKQFLTFLQFLCPDWRLLDNKYIDAKYREFKEWNADEHSAMVYLSENLNYSVKPSIEVECKNCSHKNRTLIRFRRGYKSIFDISGVTEELFSD